MSSDVQETVSTVIFSGAESKIQSFLFALVSGGTRGTLILKRRRVGFWGGFLHAVRIQTESESEQKLDQRLFEK